ncbi:hypothetical protein RIF29_11332 [Crotalaria pallida]|uniref:Glycosyltransferase n=1 Tax=Crotalaria pallida TaxID=3830 RepID=A0AAN9P011_CROPI
MAKFFISSSRHSCSPVTASLPAPSPISPPLNPHSTQLILVEFFDQKKMEKKNIAKSVHCLVLAFPAQGHINPMLQFSKLSQHEGVKVTLATTAFYCMNNMLRLPASIALETISDGFDYGGGVGKAKSLKHYLDTFWQVGPQTLEELIKKLGKTGNPVDCLIYDSFLPWGIDVAKRCGILGAVFLTQNLAVSSIYYHFNLGKLKVPITHEVSLPALPPLQLGDLPSFFCNYEKDSVTLHSLSAQFTNTHKADWVLCNTVYELEKEIVNWTMKIWPKLRTIGPSIPSMFLDKRLENDEDYGAAQFSSDEECMKWLEDKPKGSVVYVSFGTMVAINEKQIEELAFGLKDSGSYFLWAVRASEQGKLPKGSELKSEKGLVVAWCSQLKVLAHEAISCFVTHCGWNSTLESLSLGIPMIAVPQWTEQFTNAKFIADVWKIGIRATVDEKKIVTREVLKHSIWEIMESEKGKEMKRNAMQWKTLAREAVGEGGSSHKNITEFLDGLFHLQTKCTESHIAY